MAGFDDFFQNISQNTRKSSSFNLDDFEKELKKMDENIKQASDLNDFLKNSFDTPEARQAGENLKVEEKKAKNSVDEEEKSTIEIRYPKNKDSKTYGFAGVAGMADLKEELKENFIKPLKFKFLVQNMEKQENKDEKSLELYKTLQEAFEKFKVGIPTGMLFYGPPGTGKTFLTKKLAEELDAGMIEKSVGEFGSSYIHETSKNIKNFFTEAKKASESGPIILFLDEIDSLVSKRTSQVDSNKAEEVSQFLQEFNALDEAPNLIVIAATNRPDHLDSAILRSGRLDKKIYIGPPDFEARKELFQIYIEKTERPNKGLDFDKLAELTNNFVAADIEHICDEAARQASKNILELVNKVDTNLDLKEVKKTIKNSVITMEIMEKEISETTSSLQYVDMSVYNEWLEKSKN
ncbi:ATP-binding protein [Candidatus Gracilibacteria bacterium]|nr:ATP-binding protein [Candidatus Gracilibacteria bacterium]